MTEQIIALAIAMGASESQREVLEPLCAAAEQALTAQLRPGVTPESCADAFMVCAAWMAPYLRDGGFYFQGVTG